VKVTATIQETISAVATTQKMPPAYSPTAERAKPIGTKPTAVASVPQNMGAAVTVQAWAAAFATSQPSSSFTSMDSIAMIASSTRSPSAMISAPSEMRSSAMPSASITMKVRPSVAGTAMPTISPARSPMARMLTPITTASAIRNLPSKRPTARVIACAWSVTRERASPAGRSRRASARNASIRCPRARPFSPRAITTPTSTASSPPTRTR